MRSYTAVIDELNQNLARMPSSYTIAATLDHGRHLSRPAIALPRPVAHRGRAHQPGGAMTRLPEQPLDANPAGG
jgi:hypothetical protein